MSHHLDLHAVGQNPVKNEVFRKRGIETICSDIKDPKEALEDFLLKIYNEVHGELKV